MFFFVLALFLILLCYVLIPLVVIRLERMNKLAVHEIIAIIVATEAAVAAVEAVVVASVVAEGFCVFIVSAGGP